MEAVFLTLSGMTSLSLLKKRFGLVPAFLATLAWLLNLPSVLHGGNLSTEYGLLFQFLFMRIFVEKIFNGRAGRHWFVLGVLSGLLFLTKQNLIGISLAAVMVAVVSGVRERQLKRVVSCLVMFTLGGLSILIVFGVYFGVNHALKDFWDAAFRYNFAYSSTDMVSRLSSLASGLRYLKSGVVAYVGLMGFVMGVLWRPTQKFLPQSLRKAIEPGPLLLLCLLDFPLELAFCGLSGRTYAHYYMALLPVFAFFTALLLSILLRIVEFIFSSRNAGMLFCAAVVGLLIILQVPYRSNFYPFCRVKTSEQLQQTLQFIRTNSNSGDQVLVLGAETSLNFLSGRTAPTRFVYQYPLLQIGYSTPKMRAEFLNEITAGKPVLVLDATRTNPKFMLHQAGYLDGNAFVMEILSSHPIQRNCRLDERIIDWDIYRCDW